MRKTNEAGIALIKRFEGCKLKAYKCPAGIWTIGYGNTFYEGGTPVEQGDIITQDHAEVLFKNILVKFEKGVNDLVKSNVNGNQFSALVSFAWNLGIGSLGKSTLLKLVNENPANPKIAPNFNAWTKAGGVVLPGLVKRRVAESTLYFS